MTLIGTLVQDCTAERRYAAVGWGGHTAADGHHYTTEWSVMLRARRSSGDPRLPGRCDTALPDLQPGRYWPGVTALDYRLMVCGGHPAHLSIEEYGMQCFYLELDNTAASPAWAPMQDMPAARGYFEFVSYGGAAYAIGK